MSLSRQTLETALSAMRIRKADKEDYVNRCAARGYGSPKLLELLEKLTIAIEEIEAALKETP